MLSALVQSQAAIVAIVITLTLIAVQLTASALGCYGVSIFYGFLVLKLVEGAEGEFVSCVSIAFEFYVSLAYWLGAFTFVALFPYMWNIIGLLKSENIIKRLALEITRDKLLNSEEDPIQPIVDIVHASIMRYDLETTRVGLKALTDQVIKIIDLDGEEKISERFSHHLWRVSRLAISREDEDSTIEVIKNLENFGRSTAEREFDAATELAVTFLGFVESAAAKKDLGNATRRAAESLGEVGKTAEEKKLGVATGLAAMFLGFVGRTTAEEAAKSLEEIGRIAAEKEDELTTSLAAKSLAKLAISSEEVRTVIQDYFSKLEEKDRDLFQKFMKTYGQELEKLRTGVD
jgi:hypothetical protein